MVNPDVQNTDDSSSEPDDDTGSGYSVDITFEGFKRRGLEWAIEDAYNNNFDARLYFRDAEIGVLSGSLVRGELLEGENIHLIEALDATTQALYEMAEAIVDHKTNYYKDSFWKQTEPNGLDVLFLDRLTVRENYRGRRLGLALMQHVLRYCPHDVAVMKPYPLQHEAPNAGPDPEFKAFEDVALAPAKRKLREYYGTLGFEPFGTTEYMVRSTAFDHPLIDFKPKPPA